MQTQAEIASLLNDIRVLVVLTDFDAETAISLLSALSSDDAQVIGAIKHAGICVASAMVGASAVKVAIARFALARVVTLIEGLDALS